MKGQVKICFRLLQIIIHSAGDKLQILQMRYLIN